MTDENGLLETENDLNNKLSTPLKVLSFCIPLAGGIIYFMNKDEYPTKGKEACYAALWGVGFGILLNVLATLMRG